MATRREFLGGMAAFGVLGASAAPGLMRGRRREAGKLPEQGEFVIRNAYVMTWTPQPAICPRPTCT